ncbi:MAG: M14 family zinc carboxypeptidase [Simplicispira sp.]|nr:M14 family zinc carboxypeptidase [Simplicispira sp.]
MPRYFDAAQHAGVPHPLSARPGHGWRIAAVLATVLLAACSTTPLPPWPVIKAPLPPKQRPSNAPLPPVGPVRPGTVTAPVPTPLPTPESTGAVTPSPGNLAYDTAIALKFPDPGTRYNTPGLGPERRAFTTNAELEQWLRNLAQSPSPQGAQATLLQLGFSQRGTPLLAAVLTRAPDARPNSLEASKRPTVVLIGQQHGDEPASSEALMVVAQELAQGTLEPLLAHLNVIIVPRANPDGAEAGMHTTANGIDLDSDHLLLNTPEARALAVLVRDYRPILVLDAHESPAVGAHLEKFNALPRHDALLQYATSPNLHSFFTKASQEWYHEPLVQALKAQNLTSEWYYTTSSRPDDLKLSMGSAQPDNARNANGLKNAISLLVASRGIGLGHTHVQRRVHTHVTAITSALHSSIERAQNLEQVRSFVVRDMSAQACRDQVIVEAGATPEQRNITMLDPVTGEDRAVHATWNSSLKLRTLKSRARPCGYWLASTADAAIERLKLLGVQMLRVAEPGSVLADTYRASGSAPPVNTPVPRENGANPIQVTLVRTAIDVGAGSYYVPLNQPLAALAVAALEPDTPSSYFTHRIIGTLSDTARVMTTPALIFEETE